MNFLSEHLVRSGSRFSIGLMVICTLGIHGCQQTSADLADVCGVVTFNGIPFAADVLFEPLDEKQQRSGRPSSASTDARGRFRMNFTPEEDGALIGLHRVTVKIMRPATQHGTDTATHAWSQLKTVRLLRQVRSGNNEFVFALSR
ncbi:MAG: hypothetical protein O2955_12395 [Planctomycetota bacterium]|nr:hypothetical protein [Planctomycetota bacterium]MDA1213310.1 hypothetical protein [Planctomycetota bacterium]